MSAQILSALAAVITMVLVFDMLRRGLLKEKYAVLWLFFAAAALFFAIFPSVLSRISSFLGVVNPANLLFFFTIVLLVVVSVQLSYELSRHEARIRRLAEEIALLEERMRRLLAQEPRDDD